MRTFFKSFNNVEGPLKRPQQLVQQNVERMLKQMLKPTNGPEDIQVCVEHLSINVIKSIYTSTIKNGRRRNLQAQRRKDRKVRTDR